MRTEFDNSLLKNLEAKPETEKKFRIAKYYSIVFYNDIDRTPTDFEKYEALLFANVYQLYFLLAKGVSFGEDELQLILDSLFSETPPEGMEQISNRGELDDFHTGRLGLYMQEIQKLREPNNLPFVLVDKLYKNPLSSNNDIKNIEPDLIGVIKYLAIITDGMKSFSNAITNLYPNLK